MSIKPIILDGGLSLVLSPQQAPPGSLRDCLNFEVAHNRGYRQSQGIKSFSGGSASGVVDPYVFHNVAGEYGQNMTIDVLDFEDGYVIKWGDGGTFRNSTGELTTTDGEGIVCKVTDHDNNIVAFGLANITGRIPTIGDVMLCNGSTITVTDIPRLASDIIANDGTTVFSNAANAGTDYANTVDGVSDLIEAFDEHLSITAESASPVPCNPLGSIRGGFYFKDYVYCIADIETWAFTSGSALPTEGDDFRLFYTGVANTGDYCRYSVEQVITESGDWGAGTAAGKILLCIIPYPYPGPASTPKSPTDCRNETTTTNNPMTIGSLVRSPSAALWKQKNPTFASATDEWTRVDLGYEVRFSAGDNFFTVLNRSNRDTALEAGTPSTTSAGAGTAAGGWTTASNATGLANATVATDANDSGPGPALVLTNYGFNLPDNAVILGVKVTITRNLTAGGVVEGAKDYEIKLAGVAQSQNKKRSELWPTALTAAEYGGTSDLWDASLSASVVNSTDFGISISAENVNGAGARTRQVDSAVIEITYKDRSSVVYFGDAATTAITSINRVGTTATVVTTAAHGFTTGQSVTHSGANQAEYNITDTITVISLTSYTYTVAGAPATPATGTVVAFRNFSTARAIWYHKEKGDWSTTDAQGTLTLYEASAPSAILTGQAIRSIAGYSASTLATAASSAEKVRLPSSNALETNASQWEATAEVNFFGGVGLEQIFAVSGADFAGSFDSNYWIRIRTGTDGNQDKPRHVEKFGDQLVLGFGQGVCIASDLGYPESYAGVVGGTLGGSSPISDDLTTYPLFAGGAQQVLLGDSVYGLMNLADQNLAVGCKNSMHMIVGSGGSLVSRRLRGNSGIIEYTLKDIGIPVFLDYRGIGTLEATDKFGDFARGRLSDDVAPWLIPRLQQAGASFIGMSGPFRAEVVRNKNQLRVYFRDKYVLTMTMVGNDFSNPQFTIQKLPFVPTMTLTGVTSGGKDMFFLAPHGMAEYGSSSNELKALYEADETIVLNSNLYAPSFFYQGEVGNSWDGRLAIDRYIEVNGGAFGKEWQIDKLDSMIVSGMCYGLAAFGAQFGTNFQPVDTTVTVNYNGGSSADPGYFAFSERPFSKQENVKLDGYAFSVKFVASGASVYGATTVQTSPYKFRPFTLQAIIGLDEALKIRRGG